jgi:hypothetical protein
VVEHYSSSVQAMQFYYYYSITTGTGKLITDESEGLFVFEKTHVRYLNLLCIH